MAAQELADSIAEGSAPLGPQGPHQSFNFVDLSGGREKKVWFEQWPCHGSTTRRLQVLFSVVTAGRQTGVV